MYSRALEVVPGYRAAVEGLADLAYTADDRQRAEALYRRIAVDAHPDLYLRLAELRRSAATRLAHPDGSANSCAWRRLRARSLFYGRWLALLWAERPEKTWDRALAVARRDVARRPRSRAGTRWPGCSTGAAKPSKPSLRRTARWRGARRARRSNTIAVDPEALGRHDEAATWLLRATADRRLLDPGARIDLGTRGRVSRLPQTRAVGYPPRRRQHRSDPIIQGGAMPQRKGSAEWKGGLKDGRGSVSSGSGAFEGVIPSARASSRERERIRRS